VRRPAGFENRPAESVIDGQMEIFSAFSPSLRRPSAPQRSAPDTGFSLAREKRLALFFISRTVQADRAHRRRSKRPKTPLTNARRLLTAV